MKNTKSHPHPPGTPAHAEEIHHHLIYFLEHMSDGFFALDREWRFTYANRAFEIYERKKRKEVMGKKIWEAFPESFVAPNHYFSKYQEAVKNNRPLEFEEMTDNKWFEVRVFPDKYGLSVFYRDITDRKLFDERKDEFIRMASHELKTPITSLRLYGELLSEQLSDPEMKVYADRLIDQADKLAKLVTEMLDLSRIQLGKLTFRKRPFDLVAATRDLIKPLATGRDTHRVELELKTRTAPVRGDRERLRQVITNLIDNAIKYSPGKDQVIVTISREGQRVRLGVRDFGVGVDPAYKQRLFDRFYQATGSKESAFPGLGIGLYISKAIAEKHDGDIEVESELGKGATFSLILPLHHEKKSASQPRRHGR